MPESQFVAAGFSSNYYTNLKYIAHDEELHVQLLESAIKAAGATPVAACVYSFPFTDPKSFVTLSSVLEGYVLKISPSPTSSANPPTKNPHSVGTSAYLGGAPLIQEKSYLGVAGSILVTEALHTSLQRFNLGQVAPANPYGTALGLNPVFTLAAAFIKSCPSTNAALPVKAFPTLTATQGIPAAPGIMFTFSVKGDVPANSFLTFVSGLDTVSAPATVKGGMLSGMIPMASQGQTYVFVTKENVTASIQDSQILFGPAIVEVTPPSPTFDINQS